ncbi:hypothetical protein T492DRAFT_1123073 [Pavlovales sp. CCMP2436]|nr:hypothetical protein T492DRAFT_1123073 [Pavlovales sp. CCMP2436]
MPSYVVQQVPGQRQFFNPMAPSLPVPQIQVTSTAAASVAGPSSLQPRAGGAPVTPVRGSRKSPAVSKAPASSVEVMTVTGVPLIQSNPYSSPFINNDVDPGATRALAQAELMTTQNDLVEVEHLRSPAPAWIEAQRPTVRKVDLLAVPDLNKYIDDSQLLFRASFLANAQIPATKYSYVFMSKTLVRYMIMTEFYMQKSRQLVEEEALLKISKVFKGSKQAVSIDQKRADDLQLRSLNAKQLFLRAARRSVRK